MHRLWNRWIRLSCYHSIVYATCPLYIHVTSILQFIRKWFGQCSHTIACFDWALTIYNYFVNVSNTIAYCFQLSFALKKHLVLNLPTIILTINTSKMKNIQLLQEKRETTHHTRRQHLKTILTNWLCSLSESLEPTYSYTKQMFGLSSTE